MLSQLAVLIFADIVGSSALMEEDQYRMIAAVQEMRTEVIDPLVARHGGTVLKRLGDGWIISFGAVTPCIDCAMAIQRKMQSLSELKLRIGCHIGEIVQEADDILGSGLNIAQRIQNEAPPGGMMISEDVHRQLTGPLAEQLKDAGTFRLRNIAQPARLYQWRPERARGAETGDATSIAVPAIAFAPRDADTEALAGELRDQLLIRMSRRVGIVVYDGAGQPSDTATYHLRSRFRMSAGRGRLSLTLVLRAEGRPVWSESYDGDTSDIFGFCDDVLERAENDLRLQTNAFDGDRLAQIPEDDLSVSELRARAANCFYRVTYDDWAHGLRLMRRALRMSPMDGVALAMRAEAEIMLSAARYETMSPETVAELGRIVDDAVEQAPGSDYVLWARGTFRVNCLFDLSGAAADLARCRALNPAYLEAHELEGHIAMLDGRYGDAASFFGRLLRQQTHNPLLPYRHYLTAVSHYCDGAFEKAAQHAGIATDARPSERGLHFIQALALHRAGDPVRAGASLARANDLRPAPAICCRRPVLAPADRGLAAVLATALSDERVALPAADA